MNIKTEYSAAELAALIGVSRQTMWRRLKARGLVSGRKKIGLAELRAKLPEWADFEAKLRIRRILADA